MRRDSRIGMAIGGVLVAVLLVYAVVVPKTNKKKVALDTVGAQAQNTSEGDNAASAGASATATHLTEGSQPQTGGNGGDKAAPQPAFPDRDGESASPEQDKAGSTKWAQLLASDHLDAATVRTLTPGPAPTGEPAIEPAKTVRDSTTGNFSPATRPANASATSHRVAAGETFSSIAQAYYGDSRYATRIARANPTIDPRRLRPGMTIHLPGKESAGEAPQGASTSSRGLIKVVRDSNKEYVVKPNDSLYKISMRLYGRGDRADALYEANKNVIGSDSARLKVGMVLKLPDAPANAVSAR